MLAAGRQGRRGAKGAIPRPAAAQEAARVHLARGCALRRGVKARARAVDGPAGVLVHLQALQRKDAPAHCAGAARSAVGGGRCGGGSGRSGAAAAAAARGGQRAQVRAHGRQGRKDARIVAQRARGAVLGMKGQLKDGNKATAKGALVLGARGLVLAGALVNGQAGRKVQATAGGAGVGGGGALLDGVGGGGCGVGGAGGSCADGLQIFEFRMWFADIDTPYRGRRGDVTVTLAKKVPP